MVSNKSVATVYAKRMRSRQKSILILSHIRSIFYRSIFMTYLYYATSSLFLPSWHISSSGHTSQRGFLAVQ